MGYSDFHENARRQKIQVARKCKSKHTLNAKIAFLPASLFTFNLR